jgi:MYXO-CTERM domain-containing protein
LVAPPSKVRHGLFRFEIAGARGTGGGAVHLSVLYDGVPIGTARDLPIASDEWISSRTPTASGGCSVSDRSGGGDSWPAFAVVLASALLGVRRRRVS